MSGAQTQTDALRQKNNRPPLTNDGYPPMEATSGNTRASVSGHPRTANHPLAHDRTPPRLARDAHSGGDSQPQTSHAKGEDTPLGAANDALNVSRRYNDPLPSSRQEIENNSSQGGASSQSQEYHGIGNGSSRSDQHQSQPRRNDDSGVTRHKQNRNSNDPGPPLAQSAINGSRSSSTQEGKPGSGEGNQIYASDSEDRRDGIQLQTQNGRPQRVWIRQSTAGSG